MTPMIHGTLLAITATTNVAAQNKIDDMVDKFSAVGNSTFTSVVERNPTTHQVEKVVKVLTLYGTQATKMRSVFKQESNKGTFSEKSEDGIITMILTTVTSSSNRIYMLKMESEKYYPNAKVTIIIKIK